jgi:hypothetical protein
MSAYWMNMAGCATAVHGRSGQGTIQGHARPARAGWRGARARRPGRACVQSLIWNHSGACASGRTVQQSPAAQTPGTDVRSCLRAQSAARWPRQALAARRGAHCCTAQLVGAACAGMMQHVSLLPPSLTALILSCSNACTVSLLVFSTIACLLHLSAKRLTAWHHLVACVRTSQRNA